ncbi:CHASE2 domain-containing protein [Flavobacterium sp. 3HN19-14]|uniref:CHASE2 domain-containing protein n=1 Tax=Flavobacterium sp. 3HN19-14 TaxID=3448133 RepID=UPI003EE40AED
MDESKKHDVRLLPLIVVVVLLALSGWLLEKLTERLPAELIRINELAVADIDLSDAAYQINQEWNQTKKSVILVNTGSLDQGNFRLELCQLISNLQSYNPRAIGLDIVFEERKDPLIDLELGALLKNNNIVLAREDSASIFKDDKPSRLFGASDFPITKGETVRKYYYSNIVGDDTIPTPSFASVLHNVASREPVNPEAGHFMLRYYTRGRGFYDVLEDTGKRTPLDSMFPAIEGAALIQDSLQVEALKTLLKDATIIVGHLGSPYMSNPNDIRDKQRVPTDTILSNRLPVMPGAVIHANALTMLEQKDHILDTEGFGWKIIAWILVFFFILLGKYMEAHIKEQWQFPIKCIIKPVLLIVLMFLIIWLMEVGIHLRTGQFLLCIALWEIFAEPLTVLHEELKRLLSKCQKSLKAAKKKNRLFLRILSVLNYKII